MKVYISTDAAKVLGFNAAILLEHIYNTAMSSYPQNNKLKLDQTSLANVLPISISTIQRALKKLVDEEYLIKVGRSAYTITEKIHEFKDYASYVRFFAK